MKFESIKISKIRDLLSFAFKTELLFSVWKWNSGTILWYLSWPSKWKKIESAKKLKFNLGIQGMGCTNKY